MALNFGRKQKTKQEKKELFPDQMVITMLPIDETKKKGSKKFQFNKYAMEQLNLLYINPATGEESNCDISFVDENYADKTNYFIFVNNGPITYKDNNGIEHEAKVLSARITKSDNAVASQPWYDAIAKYFTLDTTQPNYFRLVLTERPDTNIQLYQFERITNIPMDHTTSIEDIKGYPKTNADEIVNELNHKMEELPIVTH